MTISNNQSSWEHYRETELRKVEPVLTKAGFALDKEQVHTKGERFLTKTRDVGGGGLKLVLLGRRVLDSTRVVIKASSDPQGIKEMERERTARAKVNQIPFALHSFKTPEELYYARHGDLVISITKYIEQERSFFEHSLQEQFFLALRSLETQEGVHATTLAHAADIQKTFGVMSVADYLAKFSQFKKEALAALPERTTLAKLFTAAERLLVSSKTLLERYGGFLTHADFVPNNLRVADHDIYLLDYSSIHFGNKYESWARFLNFMLQYNPELEHVLIDYVRTNRGAEEYLSLRLMRIYKIGFLLAYYAQALGKTEGNLHTLTEWRLTLWSAAMQAMIDDRPISPEIVAAYMRDLDTLRSADEKARQKELLGGNKIGV